MAPLVFEALRSLCGIVRAGGLARGWGDDIKWQILSEAQKEAENQNKPLMVIVHRAMCPACENLKTKFSNAGFIRSLSDQFVMVNLDSYAGEVPRSIDFAPDGSYVPRIMFFTPRGKLMTHACNHELPEFKYTYQDPGTVAVKMKNVLRELGAI